jgi:HEAT repeat-containing protein 5
MAEESINGAAAYPELDITKLHSLASEQQDLYLLTFTSELARHVSLLDSDGASAQQIYVKKELFKVINLSTPAATRVIRNNLGRTFGDLFGKGDRKLLFESINELITIIGSGKSEKEIRSKHAAAHCLGAVFEAAGDSAISLSTLASSTLLRLLKVSQAHAGLRGTVFKALGRVFKGIGASADEPAVRDAWKQARTAASSDKSFFVQANACFCMEQLIRFTPYLDNSNDFEKLQSSIWKAIDSSSNHVRRYAASCLAAALVKSYSESPSANAVPKVKKPRKPTKRKTDLEGDDEVIERPGSPAPLKAPTQLSFGITDLLRQLSSAYCRPATSNRARAGIVVCYLKALRELGPSVIESKYGDIARHLFTEILNAQYISLNRYRLLMARKYVQIILEQLIGEQLLGEPGQISAAKFLLNQIIKDYPQALKERPEPSKQTLTASLSALSSLVTALGAATNAIAETCREGLLQVLQHPSYTVQIYTSACLRAFVLACPQQLIPCVTICMNSVNRELNLLTGPRHSARRCVGFANGLSAILSTATLQPLYGSVDVNSRVYSQATSLLKSAGSSDLRISSTQIQVAWILIGGLMTLGPSFVKIHLTQLLLLWKNALPKPLTKDNMVQRDMLELSYLAHVRECALGSILTFLEFNSRILTVDVTKRLAAMLQNTAMFLHSLPQKKMTDDKSQRLSPALQLHDFDLMVRRRVLQCYTKLINISPAGSDESLLQMNLLPFAVNSFANPDNYAPSSLSTSIASSAGTFENLWDVADNSGYGVTGLVQGYSLAPLHGEQVTEKLYSLSDVGDAEAEAERAVCIDALLLSNANILKLLSPIGAAWEHDSIHLYTNNSSSTYNMPNPPATEVVNSAIELFAITLPLYPSKVQESILEQISSFLSSSNLQRDPARKAAMTVNIAVALLSALKVAVKETESRSGDLRGSPVEKVIQELLHVSTIGKFFLYMI